MNISFKRPEDVLPSVLILAAIAIMVVTLVLILSPVQTVASVQKSHRIARIRMKNQISDLVSEASKSKRKSLTHLWTGDPETISTSILAGLTDQANQLSLAVGSFRPQRAVVLDGLTELPFTVQITGPYPRVRKILSTFDAPTSKVSIVSVQMEASAQSSTNDITATVMMSAFLASQSPVSTAPTTTKASSKSKNLPPGAGKVSVPSQVEHRPAGETGGAHVGH